MNPISKTHTVDFLVEAFNCLYNLLTVLSVATQLKTTEKGRYKRCVFIPGSRVQFASQQGRGCGCRVVSHLVGHRHRACCAPSAAAVACQTPAGSSPSDAATLSGHRWQCSPPSPRSPSWTGRSSEMWLDSQWGPLNSYQAEYLLKYVSMIDLKQFVF